MDFFCSVIVLVLVAWLAYREMREVEEVDIHNVTASDYTVKLCYLPPHAKGPAGMDALRHSIKKHFEEALSNWPSLKGVVSREIDPKTGKPVAGTESSEGPIKIARITFGKTDAPYIELKQQKGTTNKKWQTLDSKLKRHRSAAPLSAIKGLKSKDSEL